MTSTTPKQIEAWLQVKSETEHLEFKEAKNQFDFDDLCEYFVAMGNEGGGRLILGITNKPPRNVVGTAAFHDIQRVKLDLYKIFQHRVDVEDLHYSGKRILVFHIPSKPLGRPFHYKGKYLMRSGESVVPMTPDRLESIIAEKRKRTPAIAIGTLVVVLVVGFLLATKQKLKNDEAALQAIKSAQSNSTPPGPSASEAEAELKKTPQSEMHPSKLPKEPASTVTTAMLTPENNTHKQAFELAQKLFEWSSNKIKERGNKPDVGLIDSDFQKNAVREFRGTFGNRLEVMTNELKRCGAETQELKKSIESMRADFDASFVASALRKAADDIPNGQPACGTGQPTKGFGAKDNIYYLLIGGSQAGFEKADLEKGRQSAGEEILGGKHHFKIYLLNGVFCVDAKVYGGTPFPLIDVICNRIGEPPNGWDTNYAEKAVEVVDQNQIPMFQMIFESDTRIRINGVFPGEDGEIFVLTPGQSKGVKPNKEPITIPIKPLFKYPAWKFPHKYAD